MLFRSLRVFPVGGEPKDERTTKIHDTFVPMAAPAIPTNAAAWAQQRDAWMQALREKSFRGWPAVEEPLQLTRATASKLETWEFSTPGSVRLPLVVHRAANGAPVKRVVLQVFDREATPAAAQSDTAVVQFSPRGPLLDVLR